ncbi:MAG: ABC transporter ATP-binding protein [Desulfobacteraceae bacterium]|nr:ABC transporter ATP-binding protein [Desulfobacteraceae bacterium]
MLNDFPIITRNLTFKAGFKKILENISLVLKKNEFVGLIGGSGSGKTTLLTCLNGFRQPTEGQVILNGIPGKEKSKVRRLIGYVPQEDIVHKTLTIERALYYSYLLRLEEQISDEKIEYNINKILYKLDLREHKNKKISNLSGGQRKRVSIGIELLHSPRLFFLDEPTAGLDPSLERKTMRLLGSLADENRLIVLTTHLMQNVEMFDILIFIHKGHMVYFGPSTEITEFFKVKDMIDLFEKIVPKDPLELKSRYMQSSMNINFLGPRLAESENV